MSDSKRLVEVIDLCSDDERSLPRPATKKRRHCGGGARQADESLRAASIASAPPRAIVVVDDRDVETTDVARLVAQLTTRSTSILTLFSAAIPVSRIPSPSATASPVAPPASLYHIRQQDKWSCGYHNTQMLLASLLSILPDDHDYFRERPKQARDIEIRIPALLDIQHILEKAWQSGWDINGAKHYGYRLATKKEWIGAVEVATALGYLHIDATIVQFIECKESRELLGPFCKAYFKGYSGCSRCHEVSCGCYVLRILQRLSSDDSSPNLANVACSCPRAPLYLQWDGHSATIIGVELSANQQHVSHLLLLDPVRSGVRIRQGLAGGNIACLRKPLEFFSGRNSQIIVCSTGRISGQSRNMMRHIQNCLTAAPAAVERSLLTRETGN